MTSKILLKNLGGIDMAKNELEWLHSNKCRYCGNELSFRSNSERIICRYCGKTNYKNKKVKFENKLKRKILEVKRK